MQQDVATFFALAESEAGADSQKLVKDEFAAFIECGILANGSLRHRCLLPRQSSCFRLEAHAPVMAG